MPSGEDETGAIVHSTSNNRTVNNTMRHQYRVLTDQEKEQMTNLKDLGVAFLNAIEKLESKRLSLREYSIAKTKIEEAVMWAVKGLTS